MHAVGEHLSHKASGAPRRLHLLIPARFRLLLPLHGSLRLRATPAPRASRHRDSRRPQLRLPGRRLSRRARGLRAPQAAPVGLPRAPSLPHRRAPLACPLSLPPSGAGGNWRRRGGLGVCPAARVRGGGPACCQRAGEGPAAPLGRARAPGGSALAGAVGAGGGGRASREGRGREGRGARRGEARGGAPGRGRGSGGRRGAATLRGLEGLLCSVPKLRVALEGGGSGKVSPERPHPGFRSPRGSVATFLSLVPLPSPQISLRKSSLLPACYCLQLPPKGDGDGKETSIKSFKPAFF